ncbi:DeoR family transcriptional regulator [Nocardia sp. NPDC059246]|uniref:DeoR family transcriptional regulator n=1 Tax=unclassified Nocardia TaxID=2637762 RepID=UPI0036C87260
MGVDRGGPGLGAIRRDLDALERDGQIHRTHGGARAIPGVTADLPYAAKKGVRLPDNVWRMCPSTGS